MSESKPLRAFHGNPALKQSCLDRVRAYREAGDIIQGTYGYSNDGSGWRGCAVGCLVRGDKHADFEDNLGIQRDIAHVLDKTFERMYKEDAVLYPELFIESIPVGADLSLVIPRFLVECCDYLRKVEGSSLLIDSALGEFLTQVLRPWSQGYGMERGTAQTGYMNARIDAFESLFREISRVVLVDADARHWDGETDVYDVTRYNRYCAQALIWLSCAARERWGAECTGNSYPAAAIDEILSGALTLLGEPFRKSRAFGMSRTLLECLRTAPIPAP